MYKLRLRETIGKIMSANLWGNHIKIMSFGESHGEALGLVIDGLPAGVVFDQGILDDFLQRRRPGQSQVTTDRNEMDKAEILSGIYKGKTIGSPVAVIVKNKDARSKTYEEIKKNPRIGHADDIYFKKYGIHDFRGGGRSSGRETLSRVIAGAFCKMLLKQKLPELEVVALTTQVGSLKMTTEDLLDLVQHDDLVQRCHESIVRCPDAKLSKKRESQKDHPIQHRPKEKVHPCISIQITKREYLLTE
jgi:chorismate synthase